jgi:hypothetical protein
LLGEVAGETHLRDGLQNLVDFPGDLATVQRFGFPFDSLL